MAARSSPSSSSRRTARNLYVAKPHHRTFRLVTIGGEHPADHRALGGEVIAFRARSRTSNEDAERRQRHLRGVVLAGTVRTSRRSWSSCAIGTAPATPFRCCTDRGIAMAAKPFLHRRAHQSHSAVADRPLPLAMARPSPPGAADYKLCTTAQRPFGLQLLLCPGGTVVRRHPNRPSGHPTA